MRDGSSFSRAVLTGTPDRVRDVADFQLRWGEFRPFAQSALRKAELTPVEADTLAWMIEVLDRIGPRDIEDCSP